ncbi:MAG TPA: hypothetical protein VHN79_03455, partial [Lacunisphaera sp.]|nr:hypothetical protein [Lacunisphaera sp.]
LEARLNALRQESTASEGFNRELTAWLRDRKLNFLNAMAPTTLNDPRYATPAASGLFEGDSLPFYETIKANLLLARDEHKPMELRFKAFARTVNTTCYEAVFAEDCAEHYLSAARMKSLPDEFRMQVLSDGIFFLVKNGHADAAGKIIEGAATTEQRERLKSIFQGSLAIARALADFSPERARAAFQEATALPLGSYESLMVRTLLSRLAYAGESALATELVEGATAIKPSPNSGQSPAGMRLDWTRHLRRESAHRPFYHRVRDILVRHCGPKGGDAKTFRRLTWLLSNYTLGHEKRAQAIAAAFKDNLFTVAGPGDLIELLASAQLFNARNRELGPELEIAILSASELDETTRAHWLESVAGMADLDTPAIATRLTEAYRSHLGRADLPASAPSRRAVRQRLAILDLRTSTEERPEALFGQQAAKDLDADLLRLLKFSYLCSRAQHEAANELMQQIDADRLATVHLYPYVASLLEATNNEAELRLLRPAAIDQLHLQLPSLWMETRPSFILTASQAAKRLQLPDAIPAD